MSKDYVKLTLSAGGTRGVTTSRNACPAVVDAARRLEHTMMTGKVVTDAEWAALLAEVETRRAAHVESVKFRKAAK